MAKNVKPEIIKAVPVDLTDSPQETGVASVDGRNKTIPLTKIIELKQKGLSCQQIATLLKCSKQNISKRLQDYEDFEGFKKDTALWYEVLQHKIYNTVDDRVIQKANLQSRVWAMAVLEDKKRLIRSQATAIIDIDHTISCIEDLTKREKILEAQYRELTGKVLNTSKEIRTDTNR